MKKLFLFFVVVVFVPKLAFAEVSQVCVSTQTVTPTPAPAPSPAPSPTPTQPAGYSSEVIISEFMPNPAGTDSGNEWVELYNGSSDTVDLTGWKLDDSSASGKVGTSAYALPQTSFKEDEYLVVTIPKGKFALNNSGTDSVRLYSPDNKLVQEVIYSGTAAEEVSYARMNDGSYDWSSSPTKGSFNEFQTIVEPLDDDDKTDTDQVAQDDQETQVSYNIVISEVFPEPDKGVDEFIELHNLADEEVNIKGLVLSDAATKYALPDQVLEPGKYFAVYKTQSKIALNNSGEETVTLKDSKGNVLSQLVYEDAPKNQSYNLNEAGDYYWSTKLTPGLDNDLAGSVLGASLPRTGIRLKVIFEILVAIWYVFIASVVVIKKGRI